jgi:cytochrome c oxidase subunit 2
MYVPVNTPIRLKMTSMDVLHSFFVPSFRVKRDNVPGMYSYVNFTPTKKGDFKVYCTEFCGTDHSRMRAVVRVVSKERFMKWLDGEFEGSRDKKPAEIGADLYEANCASCHNTSDKKKIGPGFAGLYGKKRNFSNADSVVADDAYIRESIIAPMSKLVVGFEGGGMNSFAGQLNDEDIKNLIEFIKTLK